MRIYPARRNFQFLKFYTDLFINHGDANLDGEVNLLDVDAFINVLANGAYQLESDLNLDLTVNLLDVADSLTR